MARVHGKDLTSVSIDNTSGTPVDLKAETVGVNFEVSVETHDTTTIGDQWREFTSGLKGGDDITHELMYENTATSGPWDLYRSRLTQGTPLTISFTDAVRTVTVEAIVTKLSLPIKVGDMIKFTATHKMFGAVTFS